MKKAKSNNQKADDLRIFAATYLTAVNRNMELIKENKDLVDELERLKSSNIKTEPGKRKYNIRLRMYMNPNEAVYDFTEIIQMIQFNSPELLVKILREVHHNYSVMNINEMTAALSKHEPSFLDYSESIPNELYILKALADAIEAVREIPASR
jgi:hypothetical protein